MAQQQGEVLQGDGAANTIRGTAGKDVIAGLGGDDVAIGLGAGDALSGGPGADTLREGAGNGLLFVDRADPLVDGGAGIDTVILAPGTTPYTFTPAQFSNVEAIQDAPGADTTIVFDAAILATADDDTFTFALGDGTDEVRITNSTGIPVDVRGDGVVFDGTVELRFEGVENLLMTGGDGSNSSVVSQSLSPDTASSTTVRSFSSGGENTTTVTSVTTGNPETAITDSSPTVAGPGSAAALAAEALFATGEQAADGDITVLAERLFQWLEIHDQAARALQQDNAATLAETQTGSLLSGDLFGPTGLFGLLSSDLLTLQAGTDNAVLG